MDSKFYVSLEAARLLKEKGYDGDAEYAYHENGNFSHWGRNVNDIDYLYAAPTKAESIDWLESNGVIISNHPVTYLCEDSTTKIHWSCHIVHKDGTWYTTNDLPTRLQAEDAAIIKALELLKGKEE